LTFAPDLNSAAAPIKIIEPQPRDFCGTQTQINEASSDGIVAQTDGTAAIECA
jgi:hypothetical protein